MNWAPRVRFENIKRVFENDRDGFGDPELLQEVGYTLLARCKDILEVSSAISGNVHCRRCGTIMPRLKINSPGEDQENFHCSFCGWNISWGEYLNSIAGRKLRGSEVVHVYQRFVDDWQAAVTTQQKMLAIDCLIHEFHTYHGNPTKPVAVTVISGSSTEIMRMIDSLANDPRR
jgi:hypothetical protein